MSKIGITGTIGSGKTEVCNYLRSLGYVVFDCDEENRKLLDEKGYELLGNEFRDCFNDKVLNKSKLADVIFNDERKKKTLEGIIHPILLNKMLELNDEIVFAEVPLLFEVNWDAYFDTTWLVISDQDIAIERLINRGIEKKEAVLRINNQMPVQEKIKRADVIIYNNGSLDELYKTIMKQLKD